MPERAVILPNPSGLHARPAKVFATTAAGLPATVTLSKDGREVKAESVLSVLTLDLHQGDEVVVRTDGEDADAALDQLVELIESGLGEGTG
ncbi:MAG: HPr family phosphocarrier protein [Nitriliruptoraceae bacterium]